MYSLSFLLCTGFLFCLLLTPLFREWSHRLGFVDQPDKERKLHCKPIARIGGVPIAMAYTSSFVLLLYAPLSGGAILSQHLTAVINLLPATVVVLVTGLLDDLYSLKPSQKLLGLILGAALACYAGVRVHSIAGVDVPEWLSLPVTLLWLIGCANAFNLIDGLDGLAAGIGLFATLTTLAVALLKGSFTLALATAPLAGALLAFLRFNFNPASIFLGDSGSLFIGFVLGCFGVLWSQKAATLLGMTAPLMVLAVPILDVLLSIARRFLRGRPIFSADRGHIHHRLLDHGLTPRRVTLLLYAICGVGAVLSLLTSLFDNTLSVLLLAVFCSGVWIGVQRLRYTEFKVLRTVFWGGLLRRLLVEQITLSQLREHLRQANTPLDCWQAIRHSARTLGVEGLEMRLAGESYVDPGSAQGTGCGLGIRIREGEWVNCSFKEEVASPTLGLGTFSQVVAEELRRRTPFLRPTLGVDPQLSGLSRVLDELEHRSASRTVTDAGSSAKVSDPLLGYSGAD